MAAAVFTVFGLRAGLRADAFALFAGGFFFIRPIFVDTLAVLAAFGLFTAEPGGAVFLLCLRALVLVPGLRRAGLAAEGFLAMAIFSSGLSCSDFRLSAILDHQFYLADLRTLSAVLLPARMAVAEAGCRVSGKKHQAGGRQTARVDAVLVARRACRNIDAARPDRAR